MIATIKIFIANLIFAIFWKFNLALSYLQIYWRKTSKIFAPPTQEIRQNQETIYIYANKNEQYCLSDIEKINDISCSMIHIHRTTGENIVRIDNHSVPGITNKSEADILQVSLYTGESDAGIDLNIKDYLYNGNELLSKEFVEYYLGLKYPSLAIDLDKTNYWIDIMDGYTFEIQQIDVNHYLEIGEKDYKIILRENHQKRE